ncbi:MAG: hypothetical protein LBL65_01080 [Campylobacteraceae bacterium]|jgi:hypothetical protein|nr:hypothetical protein [Campylobacteraceae bacterium]
MKKFLKILAVVILILIVFLYCLLFTQIGNDVLKPIIENKAKEASGMEIKLDKFSLRVNSIDVEATIMQNIKAKVAGGINIFERSFDLDYDINADKLPEIEGVKIDEPLKVEGKVIGDLDLFSAYGAGDIFKSAINFNTTLKDFNVTGITANVKELRISKLLAVLNQPIYSDGEISADIHITPNEKNELFGNAVATVANGIVFKDVLQKEFNLTLDKNPTYSLSSNFSVQNSNEIVGNAELFSSLATLKTLNARYDLNASEFKSGYTFDVPNFKEFETIIVGMALRGTVKLYGDVKYAPNVLQVSAKSDNLAGGKFEAKLDNDKLDVLVSNARIEEVLHIVSQPKYASTNFNAKASLSSLKNINGNIDVELTNGLINSDTVKKEFNLTLPPNSEFGMVSKATIQQDLVSFDVKFLSSLANLDKFNGTFDISKTELKSNYALDIKELAKLESVTGVSLRGSLALYGDARYAPNILQVSAKSDNLAGGKLDAKLDNDRLDVLASNVKVDEVLKTLVQPNYASANLNIKADFSSLANKDGKIDIDLNEGLLNSQTLQKEFNLTIPKTDFSAKTNIVMKGGVGNFDAKFLSSLINLNELTGNFDINKIALKSNYQFEIKDLSKFETIAHQKMIGTLAVNGMANYQNDNLYANGKSDILGGSVNFELNDMKVNLKGENLSSLETLKMLSYPAIFNAKVALNADYDISKSNGTFKAVSPSGRLVETQLGDLLKTFTNFDITSELYENMLLEGRINGANINFLFDMKSAKSSIFVKDGKIAGNTLNIPFELNIEKTDLGGKVTGTTDKPKVTIDSSQYLKNKAAQEVNRYIDKNGEKIDKAVGKALDKLFK